MSLKSYRNPRRLGVRLTPYFCNKVSGLSVGCRRGIAMWVLSLPSEMAPLEASESDQSGFRTLQILYTLDHYSGSEQCLGTPSLLHLLFTPRKKENMKVASRLLFGRQFILCFWLDVHFFLIEIRSGFRGIGDDSYLRL